MGDGGGALRHSDTCTRVRVRYRRFSALSTLRGLTSCSSILLETSRLFSCIDQPPDDAILINLVKFERRDRKSCCRRPMDCEPLLIHKRS